MEIEKSLASDRELVSNGLILRFFVFECAILWCIFLAAERAATAKAAALAKVADSAATGKNETSESLKTLFANVLSNFSCESCR